MPKERWWRVSYPAPGPVFGVVVRGDFVSQAADVAGWTVGKPWSHVKRWFEQQRDAAIEMLRLMVLALSGLRLKVGKVQVDIQRALVSHLRILWLVDESFVGFGDRT